jgi:hypothetical protein
LREGGREEGRYLQKHLNPIIRGLWDKSMEAFHIRMPSLQQDRQDLRAIQFVVIERFVDQSAERKKISTDSGPTPILTC